MGDSSASDPKLAELGALIAEIRERVRARHPSSAPVVALADLLPALHARDAAWGKVAAIGRVNPRAGGLLNSLIQAGKRLVARALDWHVREQVEFNRAALAAIEAVISALDEHNRALRDLAASIPNLDAAVGPLEREVRDTAAHWIAWRSEWERKLATNEMQFLRSVADLEIAFQHRATQQESNFRDLVRAQHRDFEGALNRSAEDVQRRLWADLERIRLEYEALIHHELRVVRQRAGLMSPPAPPTAPPATGPAPVPIDFWKFTEKFRGPEDYVRQTQRYYVDRFRGCEAVLDLGCGRGEFLELMRESGISARGVDLSEELVALCRRKGLEAETADLFEHLESGPDHTYDGIFCSQVIEHLAPAAVPRLVALAHQKLRPGGLLVMETPNPECLAIFATHFYLDPTHTRPIPPPLLAFYFEESGFGRIEIERFRPAAETMPALAGLPEEFRTAFFGALDYAVSGRRG